MYSLAKIALQHQRCFSTTSTNLKNISCKLVIIGGGAGGCSVAAKFSSDFKKDEVVVVEPSDLHYYQPMFTLIGGGIKQLRDAEMLTRDVLPKKTMWIQNSVEKFKPNLNQIELKNGDIIKYEFMVIAIGLQLDYDKIPGLVEGLSMKSSGVCSNYSPKYVNLTYEALQNFNSGNAIFTFPNSPVKCPGAPQKICYISEHYLRKVGKRDNATVIYNTALPVLFGVKKYADSLWQLVRQRDIKVNLRTNLIEVRPDRREAVFEDLDKGGMTQTYDYSMLHVTPPMSAPTVLKESKEIANETGFVDVCKDSLQSTRYSNIFAIGDCSSSPNSKTAASVAVQSQIVYKNLKSVMAGKSPVCVYNGYASCPLVTGYGTCILAEFDYNLTPHETLPIDQSKESYLAYFMKKDMMPSLYWKLMLNGYWNGPSLVRKILHLGLK